MSGVAVAVVAALAFMSVVHSSLAGSTRANIKLVNNGYEGILIAVAETAPVSESDNIIRWIKKFFNQASNDLFQAAHHRVYFRSITILVPKSWANRDNYDAATSETFNSANIVIDGLEVDTPTTRMSGECGQPGEFMQIPVGYIQWSLSNMTRNSGRPGLTIVQEWGKLRWGLREEYPVYGYPRFYRNSNRKVAAVKCGKDKKGSHVDYVTGGECTFHRTTGLPTNACYFKPDIDSAVWTFCEKNKNNQGTVHNDEAPNVHNDLCNGRSAWEVMRDHDDFRNGNSPAIGTSHMVDPTFHIVQANNEQIVTPIGLLLDYVTVDAESVVTKYVSFDSSIGRDTEFVFSYTGTTFPLHIVVKSPRGRYYTPYRDDTTKRLTISLDDTNEVGRWTVVLHNPSKTDVVTKLSVTSKAPSNDTYPIELAVSLSHQQLNYSDDSTFKLIVTAEVKRGYAPIIGSNVEVQAGSMPWKRMRDDGIGVDAVRGDGYYTTFLINFPRDGEYPVRVRATAAQGTARLLIGGGSRAFRLPTAINRTSVPIVERFERTRAAGIINVSNRNTTNLGALYPFPPGKVKDLKVIEISYEEKTVTLEWTAVGDFEAQETASSYDIRYSSDIKVLRHSFENAPQLGETDVISGKLNSPADAYEHETFVIRFPAAYEDKTLFFGLKVNHGASRISAVSNVVSALVYVPPATTTTTAMPEVKTTSNNGSSGTSIFIAIGGAAILLLVVVILGVCNSFCSGRCGSRNKRSVSGDFDMDTGTDTESDSPKTNQAKKLEKKKDKD
ncbi:hypothetical protein LSAT2_019239 [Lamellibrachia satsuma]|nr:hypothetical protein LSAT2_019239 [Lamellibrachia satsuma]